MSFGGVSDFSFDEEGFFGHTRAIERLALMFKDIGYRGGDGKNSGDVWDNSNSSDSQEGYGGDGGWGGPGGGGTDSHDAWFIRGITVSATLPTSTVGWALSGGTTGYQWSQTLALGDGSYSPSSAQAFIKTNSLGIYYGMTVRLITATTTAPAYAGQIGDVHIVTT